MFKYKGNQCVLEYQCSPISSEYYERHELYQAAGINDVWICGTQKYFGENKRLNTLEKECGIYYNVEFKNVIILDNYLNNVPEFLKLFYSKEYYFNCLDEVANEKESRYFFNKGKKFYFYFMNEIEFQDKIIFNNKLKNDYETIYNQLKSDMLNNIENMINNIKHEYEDLDIFFEERSPNEYNINFKNIKNEIKVIKKYSIKIDVLRKIYYIENYRFNDFDTFKEEVLTHIKYYLKDLDSNIEKIRERRFCKILSSQLVEYIESIKDNYYNYVSVGTNDTSYYYEHGIFVNFKGFCYGIFIKDTCIDFAFLNTNSKFGRWKNIEKNVDLNDINLLKEKIKYHLDNSMAAFSIEYIKEYLHKYNNKLWNFNVDYDDFITIDYQIIISRKYKDVVIIQKHIKVNKNNVDFENIKNLLKDKMKEINEELVNKKDGYYIKGEYVRFLENKTCDL